MLAIVIYPGLARASSSICASVRYGAALLTAITVGALTRLKG
jgi:hypothetical protein